MNFKIKDKVYILGFDNRILNENVGEIIEEKDTLKGKFFKVSYISFSGYKVNLGHLTEDNLVPEEDVFVISIEALKQAYDTRYVVIKESVEDIETNNQYESNK